MKDMIIADLGANYNIEDSTVLDNLIEQVKTSALFISNRSETQENIDLLSFEIIECVKNLYLRRGTEDVTSLSQSGLNSSYQDAFKQLRTNIVNNGKRLIK